MKELDVYKVNGLDRISPFVVGSAETLSILKEGSISTERRKVDLVMNLKNDD